MRTIEQITKKGKIKKIVPGQVPAIREFGLLDIDTKVSLIEMLVPLGLMCIKDELDRAVNEIAGMRYSREGGITGYSRWGRQRGSVYIGEHKVPIMVPRVRDTIRNREVPLDIYQKLQNPTRIDDMAFKRVLHGLSCRDYEACAQAIPDAFSLSPSSISRRFIRASKKRLSELLDRRLDKYDFVAIVIDGKKFGDDEMIIAIGVTVTGEKITLGLVQSASENHVVCSEFLRRLIERGLRYDKGLLFIIDGAKGFRKAIKEVFGHYGAIQRCQWHKRENVLSHLSKRLKPEFRKKLQAAYEKDGYQEAMKSLEAVKKELALINQSAVTSLEEGLEETLTVHRLGLARTLRQSLKTTNMIESIHAQIGQMTDKVDYWKDSNQKHRWVASALLEIEQRLNKVKGYRYLAVLRNALMQEVARATKMEKTKEAAAA